MGLYRRLFKGASKRDELADRSPEDARLASDLTEEIRALKQEVKKLREALPTDQEPQKRDRGRRGGRNRTSKDDGNERQQGGSFSSRGRRDGAPKTPPDDAPTGLLVDYLKKQKVLVFEGQDDLSQNEAFEHLARHIGQHFDLLGPFYEKMKRAVATGKTTRVDIENYSEAERSAAVQLGTLLYRHGMLKDFYYHRSPKKQLRVIPNKDGEIQQFLTGGWLEIYVVWLLSRRLKATMSPNKYQVLYNVKGTLPNGAEFESDLMACIDGRLLWLECKTGQWQDYSARFRGLVKTFGTARDGAGLVLIKPPDGSTRSRATDMLDMTLLSLSDVEGFVDRFLGIEEGTSFDDEDSVDVAEADGASRSRRGGRGGRGRGGEGRASESGSRGGKGDDSRSGSRRKAERDAAEDEEPLEDAEPAKKVGKVALQEDEAPRRRRRRRRGGRGSGSESSETKRDGSRGEDGKSKDASSTAGRGKSTREEARDKREAARERKADGDSDEKAARADGSDARAEGAAARKDGADARGDESSEDAGRRRRGSRGGRGRRGRGADDAGSASESSADTKRAARGRSGRDADDESDAKPRDRKPESKPESRPAAQADGKPAASTAGKPAAKPEAQTTSKPAAKPAAKLAIPEGMVVKSVAPGGASKPASRPEREAPVKRVPRDERQASVVAPDLSAMMAGSAKKADGEDDED